jgi:hypothetical protein
LWHLLQKEQLLYKPAVFIKKPRFSSIIVANRIMQEEGSDEKCKMDVHDHGCAHWRFVFLQSGTGSGGRSDQAQLLDFLPRPA